MSIDDNSNKNNEMDNCPQARHIQIGRFRFPLPGSRRGRIATGIGLIVGGVLGFLPILGFWMLPLGVIILSHEFHIVRRTRRRFVVWWARWREKRKARPSSGEDV